MKVVYVLWVHDMILGVYGSWSKALQAAAAYRNGAHFKGVLWKRIGGSRDRVRWFTDDIRNGGQLFYGRTVSRLEVEQWHVL